MTAIRRLALAALVVEVLGQRIATADEPVPRQPLFRVADLNIGESQDVELSNGKRATIKLLGVEETRDKLRSALRLARVTVEVNGVVARIESGNYRLPMTVGDVQIDCPATQGLYRRHDPFEDSWGLDKQARLRLWPKGSPWMEPGTFGYPIKQRWFGNATQAGNEPSFVMGEDAPTSRTIYYHAGNDIGGVEGRDQVVSAGDGLVISARGKTLAEYPNLPFYQQSSPATVYVVDAHGWIYRYTHLKSVDPAMRLGGRIKIGQPVGRVGKEEGAGYYAHLHFDIKSRKPSGKWGVEDAYAFLWEAYRREHRPAVVAVARPHLVTWAGESVTLDGSRSWSASGEISRYEWRFGDGTSAGGPKVERKYDRAGRYSEILKVADREGRVDYDFAVVDVIERGRGDKVSAGIHAAYYPSLNIRPGDPVTFAVRTAGTIPSGETWDFGDGSPPVKVRSDASTGAEKFDYAQTVHSFAKPGHYLVRVEHTTGTGATITARLHVPVEGEATPKADGAKPEPDAWRSWLDRKRLPPEEARNMLSAFVERWIQPLPLPQTPDDWQRGQDHLRHEVLRILGLDDLLPPRWDLKLTGKGTIQRDGYRIEKITYETYPGYATAGLLYIPDNVAGRVPGVVSITGHTTVSKAADYIQRRNVNLALRGCVVLCYDYHGYGERKTGEHPHHPTGGNSHDIRSFSFTRRSATALEVLDAVRALDVLTARPDVDPRRIGFTGESGGGNSTYWVAALDPRVFLAVPVSAVTTFDHWIRTDVNWDWHQRPPGIRRRADIGTLLALHAPHPLLVISSRRGTDDQEFPLHEAEKSFQWAKHVYGLFSAEDAAAHYESATDHGYQEDKRLRLYRAVERWLRPPSPRGDQELPARVEDADDLRCGLAQDNLTDRAIYREWLKPLPRVRTPSDPGASRAFLRGRLGWPEPLPEIAAEKVGQETNGPWSVEFWLIEPEPGIRLPAVRIVATGTTAPLTLIPGRDKRAVGRALRAGRQVLAIDPRGTGEIAEGPGSVRNWAWLAGRPGPGQQALDLVQAARFCRTTLAAPSVSVAADERHGWPALLAGAAAPELFDSGRVRIPFASLRDQIQTQGDSALADVPGLLERLDVPQLRELWPAGEVSAEP